MKKITATFRYIISVHILVLLILLLIRLILLFNNYDNVIGEENKFTLILTALVKGVWFDNVITCYIQTLPLVVLSILALCNKINKVVVKIFSIYYIILFGLVFAVSMSDIPYFGYFFKHLDSSIFNWKEEGGEAALMIFQEVSYYIYFAIYLIVMVVFSFFVLRFKKRLVQKEYTNLKSKEYLIYIPVTLILFGLCFLGIRGRLGLNPIRTSQSYFCDNSFLNQLGMNPAFYLMRDIMENSKKHNTINDLVSEKDAITNVQSYLGLNPDSLKYTSPIARDIVTTGEPNKKNVVLIMMESMSMDFLNIKHNEQPITPYLNELIKKSYLFDNFYSTGTHTNHGVLGTLCGLPSLLDKNAMKNVQTPICQGIATTLKESDYRTMFFLAHEAQYDNMMAFFKENGFDNVYAQEDYPSSEVVNIYGVTDKFLFGYANARLSEAGKEEKPFFATILTISNHPPYVIPEKFKMRSDKPEEQIVAYADNCIREFMENAAKEEWFNNTIFVFLGDHGKIVGKQAYDLPLSLNHIPLIIYSPSFENMPQVLPQLGGQVDVFPTIMGLLNIPYVNNTLGVDLFKENRRFMSFSSDNMLGCLDENIFYTYSAKTKQQSLFDYRNNSTTNIIDQHTALADSMRNYSASQLRVTDYLFQNNLTKIPK